MIRKEKPLVVSFPEREDDKSVCVSKTLKYPQGPRVLLRPWTTSPSTTHSSTSGRGTPRVRRGVGVPCLVCGHEVVSRLEVRYRKFGVRFEGPKLGVH